MSSSSSSSAASSSASASSMEKDAEASSTGHTDQEMNASRPTTPSILDDDEEGREKLLKSLIGLVRVLATTGSTGHLIQNFSPRLFAAYGFDCLVVSTAPCILTFQVDGKIRLESVPVNSLNADVNEEVQRLLLDMVQEPEKFSARDILQHADRLYAKPPCYNVFETAIAWILVSTFIGSMYVRTSFAANAVAAVCSVATFLVYSILPTVLPSFKHSRDFLAAFASGLIARGAASFELVDLGCSILAAVLGIVPMVPGAALTTGMIDLLAGDSVLNGSATFLYGLTVAFLQGVGLYAGIYVGSLWGPEFSEEDFVCPNPTSDWWLFLWLPMQWSAWAVLLNVPMKSWKYYWTGGALMFGSWYGLSYTDAPSDFQILLGSFLVGLCGHAFQWHFAYPSVGLFTFGFFLQVPGASTVVMVLASFLNQVNGYSVHMALVVIELAIGLYVANGIFFAITKPSENERDRKRGELLASF